MAFFVYLLVVIVLGIQATKAVTENSTELVAASVNIINNEETVDHSKCAESYCLPIGYDKLEVPFNENGAVDVSVDLDVLQIMEIDDIKFTVTFSMYFGVRWQEPRIVGPDPPPDNPYVPIDIGFVKNLWVPDVYIYHLKKIEVLSVFIPFSGFYTN
jgi:hypothetical protein